MRVVYIICIILMCLNINAQERFIYRYNGKLVSFGKKIVIRDRSINNETYAIIAKAIELGAPEPEQGERFWISDFINEIKSNYLWDSVHGLYIFAVYDQITANIDWKDTLDSKVLTPVNSPPFAVDTGYSGRVEAIVNNSAHINTNINISDRSDIVGNDFNMSLYIRTNDTANYGYIFGSTDAALIRLDAVISGGVEFATRMSTTTANTSSFTFSGDMRGFNMFSRQGNNTYYQQNNVKFDTTLNATYTAEMDANIALFAFRRTNATVTLATENQYSAFIISNIKSAFNKNKLNTIVEKYLDIKGVGVAQ